jgi:hypothetical protein
VTTLLFLLLVIPPPPSTVDVTAVARAALAQFASEPSVVEVQRHVEASMRAQPALVDSWRTRIRIAAFAPAWSVSVQGDRGKDLASKKEVGAPEVLTQGEDIAGKVSTELRFDFSKAVFDPQEMAVAREAARLSKSRQDALQVATKAYFARRRAQVSLRLVPPTTADDTVDRLVAIAENTALLDALTDGWFSEAVAASE